MINIRKLEAELWESADLLRAGSKLTSNQYCMPVLGLLFLRYAYSRFKMVEAEILKTRPVPFCLLDEVEAALDEVNVDNFGKFLSTFRNKTQFIVITHKKKTMEYADVLYGITMQESGVSKLVSVKLEEIKN